MTKFVVKKGRELKAKKIEEVLKSYLKVKKLQSLKILDIGCGTGEIISYFSKDGNETFAVDVFDQVKNKSTIKSFHLVQSEVLPFESELFDVVLSNHVIEHVSDQNLHMQEIFRTLKPNGLCYFATPNWNFLVEPHHRIPLIHYLGKKTFHKLLRIFKVYEEDLLLLSYAEMKKLFMQQGFEVQEFTAEILSKPEKYHLESKLFKWVPRRMLKSLQRFIPTNIFVLKK